MRIDRAVKLLNRFLKKYPNAYIYLWESDETSGIDIWDSEDNYKRHSEMIKMKGYYTCDNNGDLIFDCKKYEQDLNEEEEFRKEHLKISMDRLNER